MYAFGKWKDQVGSHRDLVMYVKYFHFVVRGMRNVHSFLNSTRRLNHGEYYFRLRRIGFNAIEAIHHRGNVTPVCYSYRELLKVSFRVRG